MTRKESEPATHRKKIGTPGPSGESSKASELLFCGDFDMRIARDGTWYHQGSPIRRKPLVKLFASVLRRDDEGIYWLQTPVERGRILVEDAPFTAVELAAAGKGRDQRISFRTNLDDWVVMDEGHPIRIAVNPESREPRPYILVRDRLEALILRPVYYQLMELAVEQVVAEDGRVGVWSDGVFFDLGNSA
jgi:hypothetical protein